MITEFITFAALSLFQPGICAAPCPPVLLQLADRKGGRNRGDARERHQGKSSNTRSSRGRGGSAEETGRPRDFFQMPFDPCRFNPELENCRKALEKSRR